MASGVRWLLLVAIFPIQHSPFLRFGTMARLPTSRGFDSYFGCLSGGESHTSHISDNAYDFSTTTSNTYTPALEYKGVYSTPAFLDKALEIFAANRGNAPEKPFYLHLAWQDPHWPLEASAEYLSEFADIKDSIRQQVCAMTLSLDDGISKVLSGLKQYGLWDNTVVVYVNDHGGGNNGAEGTNNNNYPLRGGKNTLWEGGVRTVGLLRAPGVAPYKNRDKFHVSDWLPTLVGLASGTDDETAYAFSPDGEPAFQYGDGLNLWPSLSSTGNQSKSARRRDWVLLETHPPSASSRSHGDALIIGDMKLIKWNETNPPIEGGWVPPPGEDTATTKYSIDCKGDAPTLDPSQCHTHWCLFNITADPCEYKDLSNELPEVVSSLVRQLEVFQTTAVTTGAADGCSPVAVKLSSGDIVWAPCDAPEVLAGATLVTHPPQAQAQAPVLVQILRQEA